MESSGLLPSFDDVKKFLVDAPGYPDESWVSCKRTSAKSVLKMYGDQIGRRAGPTERHKHDGKEKQTSLNLFNAQRTTNPNSMFAAHERSQVKGGTNTVLNALAAYLRYLEGTARDDWQEYAVASFKNLFYLFKHLSFICSWFY